MELYLPARTAVVLKERVILPEDVKAEAPKKRGGRPKKTAEVKEPEEAPKRKPGRPKKAAAEVKEPEEAPKKTTRKRKKAE